MLYVDALLYTDQFKHIHNMCIHVSAYIRCLNFDNHTDFTEASVQKEDRLVPCTYVFIVKTFT